ncbi:MAG: acyloxyacyl hydrolase [Roseinatronobacter sp.]
MTKIFSLATSIFLLCAPSVHAEDARIFGSIGSQQKVNSTEVQARYIGAPVFWGLQPVLGVSLAANDSAWLGIGSAYTWRAAPDGVFVRVTSMAGIHSRGNGRHLGGPVQFRSALDLGMAFKNGTEVGLGADHRSSAGIYTPNPGLNTAYLFVSVPIR